MLEIKNLTKIYAKSNVKSVDGLNLNVRDGEIFGFLGHNGAGKSTTIKMITGVLKPTEGEFLLDDMSSKNAMLDIKKHIGYVPDQHNVYEKLTGIQYINFMGEIYGVEPELRKQRADAFLQMFNLTGAANDQIKSYSHGMKQKIVVIGALLHNPKLWILDEPLTGLDPQSAYELKEHMRRHVKNGNIVFFSSHVIEVVEKLCDRIAIINKGKLAMVGTVDEIKSYNNSNSLEEVFLNMTKTQNDSEEQK